MNNIDGQPLSREAAAIAMLKGEKVEAIKFAEHWHPATVADFAIDGTQFRRPPEPRREAREWWLNAYEPHSTALTVFDSQKEADRAALKLRSEVIHVREVLPDEVHVQRMTEKEVSMLAMKHGLTYETEKNNALPRPAPVGEPVAWLWCGQLWSTHPGEVTTSEQPLPLYAASPSHTTPPSTEADRRDGERLNVEVRDGAIRITLPIATLQQAVQAAPCFERYDEGGRIFLEPIVTDAAKFAAEVVRELNEESEDGTTLVHKMFDRAFEEAVEAGAQGIVMPDDDEYAAIAEART